MLPDREHAALIARGDVDPDVLADIAYERWAARVSALHFRITLRAPRGFFEETRDRLRRIGHVPRHYAAALRSMLDARV